MRPVFLVILSLLVSLPGWAAERADTTRYQKLQAVLTHLGVADERDYGTALAPFAGAQTRAGFETLLKYFDPGAELKRYIRWNDAGVSIFRDRDDRTVADFEIPFRKHGRAHEVAAERQAPLPLYNDLRATLAVAASLASSSHPLRGLRIALDPGHMGSKFWDEKTGKYVEVTQGLVSEGVITLQTCLLLKAQLERLGAETMITRTELAPVTGEALESFELQPWADRELRNDADAGWFGALLDAAPLGRQLFDLFDRSREVAKIRSESERDTFFISRLDLAARAVRINEFRPHLTLVVHFDAAKLHELQDRKDGVRGYVMGNLMSGEVGSRENRAVAVRGLLDGARWLESNVFTAAVVKRLSEATNVPILTTPTDYQAIKVADGVYARNLALNRLVTEGAMTYVEVLHYDYAAEFTRLLARDRRALVDGVPLEYPARLDDIVTGLQQGVLDYVGSFAHNALD